MPFAVTPDVQRYDEALDWFIRRTVMTAEEASRIGTYARRDAFWVGASLQAEQVQRVFDHITVALEKGESFADFRKRIASTLRNDAHAETVFRNATQKAYNAGRYQQMREPDVLRFRPYWLFDAILDSRTSEICQACKDTLLHADDPWWAGHIPPLHHRCRSSIRNLRKSEAEKRGLTLVPANPEIPGEWGAPPTKGSGWKPDLKKFDSKIAKELEKKASTPATAPPIFDLARWVDYYRSKYGVAANSVGWGRASMELGLDLPVKTVAKELKKLPATSGRKELLRAIEGLDGTLRSIGGEIDPMRRAAAAVAGHLHSLGERASAPLDGIQDNPASRRARKFFEAITGSGVKFPVGWTYQFANSRAGMNYLKKFLRYRASEGTLEHELGHTVESENENLGERAKTFLDRRAQGLKAKRLSELLGNSRYASNEIAIEDNFVNPYVGKVYDPKVFGGLTGTEITSMGVEALVAGSKAPARLSKLAQHDLEHLLFTLGQLSGR